ncbi:MAG: prepilin peptidase [Syntrophaceae bacterium]
MALLPSLIMVVTVVIAAAFDIRARRIPNWLTASTAAAGILSNCWLAGLQGLAHSTTGMLAGVALLISFYLLGGMGAGDVKLMGAVGAFLGPNGVFTAFLFTAVSGGLYALAIIIMSGRSRETLDRYVSLFKSIIITGRPFYVPPQGNPLPALCYGAAIAAGSISSVFIQYIL